MSWRMERSREELTDYWFAMKESWAKREGWKDAVHFYTDIFVEAFRHLPYTLGHVAAIYVAVWAFLAIGEKLA